MILGIDPGKNGAMVLLTEDALVVDVLYGLEYIQASLHFLKEYQSQGLFAFVEKAQAMPKNGAVSMFNYGQGFGEILGMLYALSIPFWLVPPRQWTKEMFAGTGGNLKPKQRAALAAQRLFPKLDLRPSERCKKPHEGAVDGLLIAEFGRRKHVGGVK